ncbi:E3 ubiquitin-protein ligase RNF31 isoform X2 [Patagioenas fasciata]|uniref:E3 ubiquitin-protein ligase RNF31 isoform X2 n=1 Tax=Patagioenas fasciata TaxID=372321 RepID=UPI003A99DE2C
MAELGALWGALWGALVRDPQDPSPPELQPLLLVPRPPRDKWRLLDVGEILRGNVRVAPGAPPIPPLDVGAPPGALGALRTALSILEKYGRNLLQPRPPRHWRLVRFGNPVFRRTVGAMQGGRAVLRLLGYTHESPEGLGFPPGAVAPDVPRVAAVTAELLLLRMEIDLLLANQHPNPQFFTQMLLGSEEPLAPDSPAVADAEAPKHESPAEDPGWACASCTFLNQGPSVLCGVCERPRLARRPQSPPAAPSPAPPIEAPPPEAPPTKAPPSADSTPSDPALSSPAQRGPARELERQRRLREEGRRVVEIVREAEAQGVAPEAVVGVAWALGGPVGVAVGVAKAALGEALAALAGAGQGAGLGPLSIREAGLAWGHAHGHAQRALQAAIGRRRRQLQALAALGFPEVGVAGPALLQNGGNLWGALRDLQRQKLRPLLLGQWESTEPHIDFQGPDPQVPIRRCLAFLGLRSWGRAQLLVTLARELGALGEPPELRELLEAVGGCTDPRALRRRLRCRCRLCGWDMARKQAQWLTGCECPLCPDCFRGHFQVGVKEKGVQDLVCPACGKPDLADEGARTCYFSTLDTQLRQVLDPPTYQLFCQKLTELELQKDPQFLWCTKCSFGFIFEGAVGPAQCPQCLQRLCPRCQREWLPQHDSMSCADFGLWLRSRDPQAGAVGLEAFLRDHGVALPRPALPPGGVPARPPPPPLPLLPARLGAPAPAAPPADGGRPLHHGGTTRILRALRGDGAEGDGGGAAGRPLRPRCGAGPGRDVRPPLHRIPRGPHPVPLPGPRPLVHVAGSAGGRRAPPPGGAPPAGA